MAAQGQQFLASPGVPHLPLLSIELPVASRFPSGLQATLVNSVRCGRSESAIPCLSRRPTPWRVPRASVASRFPSGLQATLVNRSAVAAQSQQFLASLGVPHLGGVVIAPRRQALPVRAPGHAKDRASCGRLESAIPYPSPRPRPSTCRPRSPSPAACRPGSSHA